VLVAGAAQRAATKIMAGVGDLVQRTGDGHTGRVLGSRAIERSGGAVCGLYRAREDEERGFLGSALKPRSPICEWFGLKITWTVFTGLTSKPVVTVSSGLASKPAATVFASLVSKPVSMVFSSLASKLVVTVSPGLASKPVVGFFVEPQNQGGGGFPGLGLKIGSSGLVIWASKPSGIWFVGCATKLTEGGRHGTHVEM
jgi:hypothetical protein